MSPPLYYEIIVCSKTMADFKLNYIYFLCDFFFNVCLCVCQFVGMNLGEISDFVEFKFQFDFLCFVATKMLLLVLHQLVDLHNSGRRGIAPYLRDGRQMCTGAVTVTQTYLQPHVVAPTIFIQFNWPNVWTEYTNCSLILTLYGYLTIRYDDCDDNAVVEDDDYEDDDDDDGTVEYLIVVIFPLYTYLLDYFCFSNLFLSI